MGDNGRLRGDAPKDIRTQQLGNYGKLSEYPNQRLEGGRGQGEYHPKLETGTGSHERLTSANIFYHL